MRCSALICACKRVLSISLTALVVSCLLVHIASAATFSRITPNQNYVGQIRVHLTSEGEVFPDIARNENLGFTELMSANRGADPWLSPAGTPVILSGFHILPDAAAEGIVVNLAAQRLFYFHPDSNRVSTFPIGVSREGHTTPLGNTSIVRKKADPIWYPTKGARAEDPSLGAAVPPGPDNPLGRHALYLDWPLYLIHGTNRPDGVGRTVSRGCLRLYPEDIEKLFELVPVGTKVQIVDQEAAVTWIGNQLYVQVFPTREQAEEIGISGKSSNRIQSSELYVRVMEAAERGGGAVDWMAVERAGLERTGMPVRVGSAVQLISIATTSSSD
jgi:L,D-transpeptidase ErfK/SrfK